MKQVIYMLTMMLLLALPSLKVAAQAAEIQQLVLNYQKLAQLKAILENMYKGYEILNKGYNTVKGLSEGNFRVHDVFLNGLMQVSPAVRNYERIAEIIEAQASIVTEYKNAARRFRSAGIFDSDELRYFDNVYESLFKESLKNLDALTMVITSNKLRMSDDERLKTIDRIFVDTNDKLSFLRHFNSKVNVLSLQRIREENDINTIQQLHGLKNDQ